MTKKERILRAAMIFICISCVAFSLAEPQISSKETLYALSLCAERIVPSLFLFTVASKLLIQCGGAGIFARFFGGIFEKLFHVSGESAAAMILGMISGYPMGAVALAELVSSGRAEKSEAESILPFITAASPGFLIGSVGSAMFDSKEYGALLLLSQVISGFLLLFLTRGSRRLTISRMMGEQESFSPFSALTSAIKESGQAVITVCSFVTFFCVFSKMASVLLPISGALGAMINGIFEISGGFFALSESGAGLIERYFYGGAMLGFSGVSVLMQTASVVCESGLSMKTYLKGKAAQAMTCGCISLVFGVLYEKGLTTATFGLFGNDGAKWMCRIEFGVIFVLIFAVTAVFAALGAKILSFFSKKQENFQKTVEKKR